MTTERAQIINEESTLCAECPVYEIRSNEGSFLSVEYPGWNGNNIDESIRDLTELYAEIFREASINSFETLYLPLLGEATEGVPVHRSAEALWEAACTSEYNKTCIVMLIKDCKTAFTSLPYTLKERFGLIYFHRPKNNLYMGVSGTGIETGNDLICVEKGQMQSSASYQNDQDGVFSDPVKTYDYAKLKSEELAVNLYAVMHPLYFAPQSFVMNICGELNDGTVIVVFKPLGTMRADACGIVSDYCNKDSFIICRIPDGCGNIRIDLPDSRKSLNIKFYNDGSLPDSIEYSKIRDGAEKEVLEYGCEGPIAESFMIIDHYKRTAYRWHIIKERWIESTSLHVELEWGSQAFRSMKLMPGFQVIKV